MNVLIVPGHGGSSKGAVSADGSLVEADYVLAVGVAAMRAAVDAQLPPRLMLDISRIDNDRPHGVRDRVRIAKAVNAELVIELHCDASKNPEAHGLRAYYWPSCRATKQLAKEAVEVAPPALREHNAHARPVSPDGYPRAYGLLQAYPMPCLLVEFGFVTSPIDVPVLRSDGMVDQLADLVLGLCRSSTHLGLSVSADEGSWDGESYLFGR